MPWYAPWRSVERAAADETDAADLGTAFGLDLSLQPLEDLAPADERRDDPARPGHRPRRR
ncbi:MAG: hypothetical protein AMXMBFR66_10980 [Pseudomonadota bacterium]